MKQENLLNTIARNYERLKNLTTDRKNNDLLLSGEGIEDAFQSTVLYLATDPKATKLKTDDEIIELFLYRFRMFDFKRIKNHQDRMKRLNNGLRQKLI